MRALRCLRAVECRNIASGKTPYSEPGKIPRVRPHRARPHFSTISFLRVTVRILRRPLVTIPAFHLAELLTDRPIQTAFMFPCCE